MNHPFLSLELWFDFFNKNLKSWWFAVFAMLVMVPFGIRQFRNRNGLIYIISAMLLILTTRMLLYFNDTQFNSRYLYPFTLLCVIICVAGFKPSIITLEFIFRYCKIPLKRNHIVILGVIILAVLSLGKVLHPPRPKTYISTAAAIAARHIPSNAKACVITNSPDQRMAFHAGAAYQYINNKDIKLLDSYLRNFSRRYDRVFLFLENIDISFLRNKPNVPQLEILKDFSSKGKHKYVLYLVTDKPEN